jgi:hypothetical protein
MRVSRAVTSAVAALALVASGASAQAGLQNPAPVRAITIDGGYAFRFDSAGENEGYYRLAYKGKPVREKGTPFKRATSLDLVAPKLTKAGGDVPTLAFRYEHDAASAGGGLLEALGAKELPLSGLSSLGLRGVAQMGADSKLDHIQAAVGLETPPVRVPGFAQTGASNWLVIGINAERREATDSTPDVNLALATFRGFLGKAFGWRKSADVNQTAAKLVKDILELAPTHKDAVALSQRIQDSIPVVTDRTPVQRLIIVLATEVETDAAWTTGVRDLAFGHADAITDQPTAAIYTEWSGWLDLASDPTSGRFRSLFTATVDYWFLHARDDVLLSLRYELGYERATPQAKKNQFLVTIGLRL